MENTSTKKIALGRQLALTFYVSSFFVPRMRFQDTVIRGKRKKGKREKERVSNDSFTLENEFASGCLATVNVSTRGHRCAYQVADRNSIRRHNQVTRNAYTPLASRTFSVIETCRDSRWRHAASFCLHSRGVQSVTSLLSSISRTCNLDSFTVRRRSLSSDCVLTRTWRIITVCCRLDRC